MVSYSPRFCTVSFTVQILCPLLLQSKENIIKSWKTANFSRSTGISAEVNFGGITAIDYDCLALLEALLSGISRLRYSNIVNTRKGCFTDTEKGLGHV